MTPEAPPQFPAPCNGERLRDPRGAVSPLTFLLLSLLLFPWRISQADDPLSLEIIVVDSLTDAQAILNRLQHGEDFSHLAEEKSTDPSARQGGDIGAMDPAGLRVELRDALKGIAPGHLSNIVHIPSGYAILKVVAKSPAASSASNPTPILPFAGQGNVRLSADIGGFTQANIAVAVNKPKDRSWGQDLRSLCAVRQQAIPTLLDRLNLLFTQSNVDPDKVALAHFTAGELWAYQGKMDGAIQEWEAAYHLPGAATGKLAAQLEEGLGLAYLYRASPPPAPAQRIDESYLFPTHPGALHPNTADLAQAAAWFVKCLQHEPSNGEVRWLLNLCHMIGGTYPSGVPKQYLIDPAAFQSEEAYPRFPDVAPAAGLNVFTEAGGAIVEDFDNDGLLDIVTSEQDDCAPLHFFHNNGDGSFADQTAQAKLSDQLGGLNITQADYNNDGCVDILVLRGAWEYPKRLSLLRNNCDGTFSDVTEKSGLAQPPRSTQSAVWTDIDNDGNLDLFIANENAPTELLRNNGDGTFTDISKSAGVDRVAFSKSVAAADYDHDGYPDLYVSNLNGDNFLYRNNGNQTFTEVASALGVERPWASFAAWFFDYDNDGWPDLFVNSYYMSTEETARHYQRLPPNAETLKLYKNLGNGHFRDVTAEVKLDRVFMPMGSNFGDIDNDGFLDIYLGNGNPSYASLVPNVLLRNKEGKSFVDITASTGTGAMSKGHGVAFADLDSDGDEDIFVVMGGAVPGDRHRARLFENPGNGNDWISLQLAGVKSNRSAIGAQIKVTVRDEKNGLRSIYRTVSTGGSFGASPLQQHIGLGHAAHIESIEIFWPTSHTTQKFSTVPVNQYLRIKEFDTGYSKLTRPRLQLGGAQMSQSNVR